MKIADDEIGTNSEMKTEKFNITLFSAMLVDMMNDNAIKLHN